MPIYHSQISGTTKQRFLSYLYHRHGIEKVFSDSELTEKENRIISMCRSRDLEHIGINTQRWRLTIKAKVKSLSRDEVVKELGVSKSYASRLFSSLENKGRVFYDRQCGRVSYIPTYDEIEGVPGRKIASRRK